MPCLRELWRWNISALGELSQGNPGAGKPWRFENFGAGKPWRCKILALEDLGAGKYSHVFGRGRIWRNFPDWKFGHWKYRGIPCVGIRDLNTFGGTAGIGNLALGYFGAGKSWRFGDSGAGEFWRWKALALDYCGAFSVKLRFCGFPSAKVF